MCLTYCAQLVPQWKSKSQLYLRNKWNIWYLNYIMTPLEEQRWPRIRSARVDSGTDPAFFFFFRNARVDSGEIMCFSFRPGAGVKNLWKNWPEKLLSEISDFTPCTPAQSNIIPVTYAENFHGGFHLVAYGGHLYLVCAVVDVTIWRNIHVSKPKFWRSWHNMHILPLALPLLYVSSNWI